MKKLLFALPVLFAVACAPSINPQMKSATDSLVASVRGSHEVSAPASLEPMSWAPGQWITMRMTDVKNGRQSVMKISVVGAENGGFWVETDTQDYFHHSITKVLYSGMPHTAEEATDKMQKIITWSDDKERQEMDFTANSPAMAFSKSLMKSFAQANYVPDAISAEAREDVSVAAGTFRGCARYQVNASVGPVSQQSKSWFHPKVPLNGVVKASSDDGQWTSELLDFGLTGARSALE